MSSSLLEVAVDLELWTSVLCASFPGAPKRSEGRRPTPREWSSTSVFGPRGRQQAYYRSQSGSGPCIALRVTRIFQSGGPSVSVAVQCCNHGFIIATDREKFVVRSFLNGGLEKLEPTQAQRPPFGEIPLLRGFISRTLEGNTPVINVHG